MSKTYRLHSEDPGSAGSTRIDYRGQLNPSQVEVVLEGDGPCLVLAGAGSGKTRTLIYRVAYLLEKGVRPEEILLVTFTNKAAQEMRNRVEALLQTQAKGLWCGTFHHVGNRCLRVHGKEIGLPSDFGILDEEDSRELVKTCVKLLGPRSGEAKFPKPAVVQSILSFAVNAKRSIADVVASRYPYLGTFTRDFERISNLYDEKKRKTNNLDYDDLLVRWVELLCKSPKTRERLTGLFRYCLVDEYQDTNRIQQELVTILSEKHRNLLVVGDDAQSIYSFRAAEIKNILNFPDDHPGTRVFKLETNYRSTRPILELANRSISHNVHQFPKTLRSLQGEGPVPQLVRVRDARQEARFVVQRIQEFQESGVDLSQIAVLFRAHFQSAELELELTRRGLPYLVRGGVRFFEQAHVKDALAFLRVVANPKDELAWTRALTLQPGIGAGYAERIFLLTEKEPQLRRVAGTDFGSSLPPRVREGLSAFKKILQALTKEGIESHPDAMLEQVLALGYNKHVLMNFDNAQERLDDLRELVNFAHTYKGLKAFLADVTLREGFRGETFVETGKAETAADELVLSTIHQAKGLEWTAVFVIGLSEGQFPHAKSMQSEEAVEEERRLFYVASTRAKRDLVLVHPMTRFDYNLGTILNRPSPFVTELPASAYEDVEVEETQEEETIYLD